MKLHRWFQLRLSTLIALSFVAGGLLAANLTKNERLAGLVSWGWPRTAIARILYPEIIPIQARPQEQTLWDWNGLLIDIGVAAAILLVTALVLETIARRREVRS